VGRLSIRRWALVTCAAGALVAAGATVAITSASAATCSDVEVVFARGSTEAPGLGIVGRPLASAVKSRLSGRTVTSYAVDYAARMDQRSAGPGATDMTNHVTSVAAQCPNTRFVLGGYSQGASVTDISIGIRTILGTGTTIPTDLSDRVKAVVVFGNPLRLSGGTINKASQLYGSRALDICNPGDPVCGGGFNGMAHLTYAANGSVAKAADFVKDQFR
jgi:cutinase